MTDQRTHRARRRVAGAGIVFAGYLAAVAACGSNGPIGSNPVAPSVAASTSAAQTLEQILTATIQDEYHAEAVYERVLAEHGDVFPFVNIVRAEARHAGSIAGLFTARGLAVPVRVWTVENVPGFATVPAACAAAAEAEIDNVALYDGYLSMDLPVDVRTVFANNRAASINNHWPAFNACR